MNVEEPADERALEPRTGALVDREPGARDLRAAGVVDDVERLGELPMWLPGPALPGLARQRLAPRSDRHVRVLATDRDVGVRRVRDPDEEILEVALGVLEA